MKTKIYNQLNTLTLLVIVFLVAAGCSKTSFKDILSEPDNSYNPSTTDEPPVVDPQPNDDSNVSMKELFIQNEHLAKMDILFIDDNSASMAPEQTKLGERLSSFIDSLTNIDWQIGITTTDVSTGTYGIQGRLLEFTPGTYVLNSSILDYESLFLNTIVRQETLSCSAGSTDCPSATEQPLKAIMMAMDKKDFINKDFFRSEADLAVIVLSDEDEMSNGGGSGTKPQQVINKFETLFGSSKKLSVYGVIIKPTDSSCLSLQGAQAVAHYGTHVEELSRLTNGVTSSICETDYGPGLMEIGRQIRNLAVDLELKANPKMNSVVVTLVPEDNEVKWEIKGKKVHFIKPPRKGTHIEVAYTKEK